MYSTFSQARVVVIGDAMLDRYWQGDTTRISPEAPVPIVHIDAQEARLGGAANVAVNVQALGARAFLITAVGEDEAGKQLTAILKEKQVTPLFLPSADDIQTTVKLRVLGRHQQLIRLDFEHNRQWPAEPVLAALASVICKEDVVILSDYAKGVLYEPQKIIAFARARCAKVLIDPKNPDCSVYQGAYAMTPNLREFEAMVGPCEGIDAIAEKGKALMAQLGLHALLVTQGAQGMTVLIEGESPWHIASQAKEVFDITGAGDTVVAVLGAALGSGMSLQESARLANIAAGMTVGKLGTASITPKALWEACHLSVKSPPVKKLSLSLLLSEVARRKALGEKIVMTNGCFDILHAGHISYLEEARRLGDCLIVAVNTDESVRTLKGKTRPIHRLAHRLAVLEALACVDYIISFSEETPEALIQALSPQVLVKGGDYAVSAIAGSAHVLSQGGEVKILPLVPGCSTTQIVEKIRSIAKEEVSG